MSETTEDLKMPELRDDKRIVLQQTRGRMAGIFTICGRESHIPGNKLPEFELAENMLDMPSMREPGPVCLVAVKPRYVLYRQIFTPKLQNGKTFNEAQR